MSPEEQNIAIAEIRGWRKHESGLNFWHHPDECEDGACIHVDDIPNYTGDLNAMHEAEKVLTQEQKIKRVQELCKIIDRELGGAEIEPSDVCSPIELTSLFLDATAAQRAEAFLKALGKWKS